MKLVNKRLTRRYAQLFERARRKPEDLRRFWKDVQTDFRKNNVDGHDFSIRECFERFTRDSHGDACGKEIIESWVPEGGYSMQHLEEAGPGAVTTAAFSNIIGQIVYNTIMPAWQNPRFIADELVTTVPTQFKDGEKIPGISAVGDDAETVGEGQPYPLSGITEAFVETPRPFKRGHILPLTREVIMTDRTGELINRAETITTSMRINKEKRVMDTVIGVVTSWKRNGSAATATYADSGAAPHNFDNVLTNSLVDYTDIEEAMALFDQMTDPETGEPIVIMSQQLLVSSDKLYTARRVVNATEIVQGAISATVPRTISPNPLNNPDMGAAQMTSPVSILTSPYVRTRAVAGSLNANYWWFGDFKRAFRYMQFWPLSTITLPTNSLWEFQNDVVRAWRVSEYGAVAVLEPRHVIRSTGAS